MDSLPSNIQQSVDANKRLKMSLHKGQKPALIVLPKICQLFDIDQMKKSPNERRSYYSGIPVMFSDYPENHLGYVVMEFNLTKEHRNHLKVFNQENNLLK